MQKWQRTYYHLLMHLAEPGLSPVGRNVVVAQMCCASCFLHRKVAALLNTLSSVKTINKAPQAQAQAHVNIFHSVLGL